MNGEVKWLSEPSRQLFDGLVACGLVRNRVNTKHTRERPKTAIVKQASPNSVTTRSIKAPPSTPRATAVKEKPRAKTRAEPKKHIFVLPPDKFATTTNRSPFVPQVDDGTEIQSSIVDMISSKGKTIHRKQSASILFDYREQMEQYNLDSITDPSEKSEAILKLTEVTFYAWNRAIIEVKAFSEEQAVLLNEIKRFFQHRMAEFPQIYDDFEVLLQNSEDRELELQDQVKKLESEVISLESDVKARQQVISTQESKILELKTSYDNLLAKYDSLAVDHDDLNEQLNTTKFHLTKVEAARDESEMINHDLEKLLEGSRIQLKAQEDELSKYQLEGAGFRPLYNKAMDEVKALEGKLANAFDKMSKMVEVVEKNDKEIQTEVFSDNTVSPRSKRKKGRPRSPEAAVPISVLRDIPPPPSPPPSEPVVQVKEVIKYIEAKPKVIPKKSIATSPIEEIQNTPIQEEPNFSMIDLQNAEDGNQEDQRFEFPPTLCASIYRLLPLPMSISLDLASLTHEPIRGGTQMKPFSWLLNQIISFLDYSIQCGDIVNNKKDVPTLYKEMVLQKCKINSLMEHLYQDTLQVANAYQSSCSLCGLFLDCLLGEYSTTEFKFISILYNITAKYFSPDVEDTIHNLDLKPLEAEFTIPQDIALKVIENTLPHATLQLENDPVLFTDFITESLKIFKGYHSKFNRNVRNVLKLVGHQLGSDMCRVPFQDFLIFVNPAITEADLAKHWNKFIQNGTTQKSFMQYCGDVKEITDGVMTLQLKNDMEMTLDTMKEPLRNLIEFIKSRFTQFAYQIITKLDGKVKNSVFEQFLGLRNFLLMCDVSNSLTQYRSFLQVVDTKITEEMPYMTVAANSTIQDIHELIAMLKGREKLAAGAVGEFLTSMK